MPAPTPPLVLRAWMADLADHVANGGTIVEWGKSAGLKQHQAIKIWRKITDRLGVQAR
ncbi:hypothetical protein [uncultured Sphingomonas sp.]|uniref:hypothetical protein n=1 Tax=uncultured Sphingomonas sp. TaxID=158754 RepID=UPI0025D5451B|nr:hypothetical protein [uncultured Sphingomonas sp.]